MLDQKEQGLTYQNRNDPECPSPSLVLCYEAANDGSDDLLIISIFHEPETARVRGPDSPVREGVQDQTRRQQAPSSPEE